MVGFPGDCTVCDSLGENHHTVGFAGHLSYLLLMLLVAANRIRTSDVALVTTWSQDQTAISFIDIGELERNYCQTIVHPPIAEDIILIGIETWARRAVKKMPLRPLIHLTTGRGDDPGGNLGPGSGLSRAQLWRGLP